MTNPPNTPSGDKPNDRRPPKHRRGPSRGKPPKQGFRRNTGEKRPQPERRPKSQLSQGAKSRLIIARALQTVWGRGISIEEGLEKQPGFTEMPRRDRAFCRNVLASTFRHWGQINYVLEQYLSKEPPIFVMSMLRIAVAQSLFLDTPDHAVVGESCAALKTDRGGSGFVGMANAVLRRMTETGRSHLGGVPPHRNIPDWIFSQWSADYGKMEARRIARQLMKVPPLDLSVKPEVDLETLSTSLTENGVETAPLIGRTIRATASGNIRDWPGFEDGDWWVQDVASSLPVQLLNEQLGSLEGKEIWDLCAAPGGKTLQLAALGAKVTAVDISDRRLGRLKENLKRCQLEAEILKADILELSEEHGQIDHALLDAPCTATGTFRRNPEVLYNRKKKDQDSLVKLQARMLDSVAKRIKPGGTLTFCTCSLQKSEGESQIKAFLERSPQFSLNRVLIHSVLVNDSYLGETGFLRARPNYLAARGGMDGFFAATLTKSTS